MITKRASPKKQRQEDLPDTCGICRHSHDVSGQEFLLCYVNPPAMLSTGDGQAEWHRGAPGRGRRTMLPPVQPEVPGVVFKKRGFGEKLNKNSPSGSIRLRYFWVG